jgi:hypothetical protein
VLRPASGLLTALIILSVAMGVAVCLTGFLAPNQHQAIKDFFDAVSDTANATTSTEPRLVMASGSGAYRLVSSLGILAEVGVWVVTAIWLTRVRQNALVLRPGGQRRSESWVWLGWVIPVVNLWFPKQIVDDTLAAGAAVTGRPRPGTGLWWTAWIVMSLLTAVQATLTVFAPNDGVRWSILLVNVVATSLGLLSWIRIVRRISADQDSLLQR